MTADQPIKARLRLPGPGHNVTRNGEALASPYLVSPSCFLTYVLYYVLLAC